MKKILCYIILSLFILSPLFAGNTVVYEYEITVSTYATQLAAKLSNRKYFLAVNNSDKYDVKIASWTLKNTDKAVYLDAGYGAYEDAYFVYVSTWYAVNMSTWTTVTVSVMEKE